MKPTHFIFTFLTLAASTFAQEPGPREQFQPAVVAYQKSPTRETALKVIELYKQLDPPPAVPEEAREPFVMGVTVLKRASDPAGAIKAVALFTQSLKVAPWFAEAYYNRALARETASQFDSAMDDLRIYLEFKLSDLERREAQDKIYSLKADAQLAAAKQAEIAVKKQSEKAAATNEQKAFDGHWVQSTPRRYSTREDAPLSVVMCEYDISFADNGEAKVHEWYRQYNSGRWIRSPVAEFRGHLENGVLVVNPTEPSPGERKRELRFSRIQQGLYLKTTVINFIGGQVSEMTMEYQVRR